MREPLFTYLHIDGNDKPNEFEFNDLDDVDGKKGKTAEMQRDEFDLGIIKLNKSLDKGHHYSTDMINLREVNSNYFDVREGNGIEPETEEEKIIPIAGMLNTKSFELSYRQMQVCWCYFFLKITNNKGIVGKIGWSSSKIDQEMREIKDAFGTKHLNVIEPLFFARYPDYIFSNKREVKVKPKRVRDRRKKKLLVMD